MDGEAPDQTVCDGLDELCGVEAAHTAMVFAFDLICSLEPQGRA